MEVSKMLYPIYVHLGDKQHAYGVTLPDFPGCFSAADSWEDLPAKIQEAVELHFEGEELEIHRPTPLNELAAQPEYQGGVWMMVDIDLARIRPKAVRINISLPDLLVRRIDAYAKAHHMSRSGFLAKAAEEAMRE
jgi:predicted RNase H-like HicB family nuclease